MQHRWNMATGDGKWGIGWILRDHTGHMLWAGARKLSGIGSVLEIEAEAMRWAVHTMVGFGYKGVVFESDSQVLTKMLNGEEEIWPRVSPIIQEISNSISEIREGKVAYYPRSGNKVADRVAKETTAFTSFVPKLYSIVPIWLLSSMEADQCVV